MKLVDIGISQVEKFQNWVKKPMSKPLLKSRNLLSLTAIGLSTKLSWAIPTDTCDWASL